MDALPRAREGGFDVRFVTGLGNAAVACRAFRAGDLVLGKLCLRDSVTSDHR